jgi:hypothetical protein
VPSCPVKRDKGPGRSWKREREDEETILPGSDVGDLAGVSGLYTLLVRASRILSAGSCSWLFASVLCAVRMPAGGPGGWLRRTDPKLERAGSQHLPDRLCSRSLRQSAHDLLSAVLIVPAAQLGIAIV